MSQNNIYLNFSDRRNERDGKGHLKKIKDQIKRAGLEVTELDITSEAIENYDYRVSCSCTAADDPSKAMELIVKYAEKYIYDSKPYAEIYMDQVNESIYYLKISNKVLTFNNKDEFEEILNKNFENSSEHRFHKIINQDGEFLFVRLRFEKTQIPKTINTAAQAYLNSKNDELFADFKQSIDGNLKEYFKVAYPDKDLASVVDFPSFGKRKAPQKVFDGLIFSEAQGNFLYLGFECENILDYCPIDGIHKQVELQIEYKKIHDEYKDDPMYADDDSEYEQGILYVDAVDVDEVLVGNMLENIACITRSVSAKIFSPKLNEIDGLLLGDEIEGIIDDFQTGGGELSFYIQNRTHPCVW